jgi:hypothetical protein
MKQYEEEEKSEKYLKDGCKMIPKKSKCCEKCKNGNWCYEDCKCHKEDK